MVVYCLVVLLFVLSRCWCRCNSWFGRGGTLSTGVQSVRTRALWKLWCGSGLSVQCHLKGEWILTRVDLELQCPTNTSKPSIGALHLLCCQPIHHTHTYCRKCVHTHAHTLCGFLSARSSDLSLAETETENLVRVNIQQC